MTKHQKKQETQQRKKKLITNEKIEIEIELSKKITTTTEFNCKVCGKKREQQLRSKNNTNICHWCAGEQRHYLKNS